MMLTAALLLAASGGPPLAEQAAAAFTSICLKNRQTGIDATRAALATFGAQRQPDLPPIANSKPLEVWTAGDLEFLVRPNGGRYGCFVAFKPVAETDTDTVRAALSAQPDLAAETVKPSKRVFYEWTFRDGSKDSVRLTPNSQLDGVLINLEVGRK